MAEPFRQNLIQPTLSHVSSGASPAPPALPSAESDSRKRAHLHGLHHSHHHRQPHKHQHRSSRHHAKEVVQSAFPLQPPTSFGNLLRSATGSHSDYRDSASNSTRGSFVVKDDTPASEGRVDGGPDVLPARTSVRPEDLEREKTRVKVREEELRSSLHALSDQSLKTSRYLDDTFYSLLERIAQCRQTIGSLQELSSLTNELHENFQSDTKALAEDIQSQLEGFDSFSAQQEQITALEARIKSGREKADALKVRLGEARRRVDARAKLETELEAKNIRRMRILWVIVGTIMGLVSLLIVFRCFKPAHTSPEPRLALDSTSKTKILDAPIPDIAKEVMSPPRSPLDVRLESPAARSDTPDQYLRMFDEL